MHQLVPLYPSHTSLQLKERVLFEIHTRLGKYMQAIQETDSQSRKEKAAKGPSNVEVSPIYKNTV